MYNYCYYKYHLEDRVILFTHTNALRNASSLYIWKKYMEKSSVIVFQWNSSAAFLNLIYNAVAERVSNCFHFVVTWNFSEAFSPNVRRRDKAAFTGDPLPHRRNFTWCVKPTMPIKICHIIPFSSANGGEEVYQKVPSRFAPPTWIYRALVQYRRIFLENLPRFIPTNANVWSGEEISAR